MVPQVDLSVASRAAEFATLLGQCEVTSRDNALLGLENGMAAAIRIFDLVRAARGMVYVVGNGGSAAIASHAVNDFVNAAGLRAQTLHDPSLLTCMANDYGYENAFAQALGTLAGGDDVLIAISSSGNSMNIRNAAAKFGAPAGRVITLSGFASENPLRSMGDINFWLNSADYGLVEVGHQFILHNLSDRLVTGRKA
jgi:D-sedoheptulose 7-phosphate isomerase